MSAATETVMTPTLPMEPAPAKVVKKRGPKKKTAEEADKRTPILTVRVVSDLPESERLAFEYLSTDSDTFARYADARANRRDPFFIEPAGGADICNIPVPVRRVVD